MADQQKPETEVERLREALRWYADPGNYRYGEVQEQRVGQRARDALDITLAAVDDD